MILSFHLELISISIQILTATTIGDDGIAGTDGTGGIAGTMVGDGIMDLVQPR